MGAQTPAAPSAVPELPDITVYIECLAPKVLGERLASLRIANPFLLRSVEPTPASLPGFSVRELRRIGKRIVFGFEGDLFLVMHLMIAGRLAWRAPGAKLGGKSALCSLEFEQGALVLTEAGSTRRASLHIVRGAGALAALDPGGLEVFDIDALVFREVLTRTNHTLKRALTDPHLLSGIGNAYSDEILHTARLSPVQLTANLDDDEWERLFAATQRCLSVWTDRLRAEAAGGWPKEVTAFREDMAVHGRYRKPCPVCAQPVQRIVYATRETNYCPTCQTEGRLLADRALSRLLKSDWPKSLEELEGRRVE